MTSAIVVGGGLGGSLLALYLSRRGYSVDVFERHDDERSHRAGKRPALNITLCERGLAPLEAVGARAAVLALAAPARGRLVHVDGSVVYQPYGNNGEAIYSIARSDLNDALLGLAEASPRVRCHFGKRCTGLDLSTARVWFEDTHSNERLEAKADFVVGADGAFSTVRQEFQRNDGFNFSQSYWRHGGYKSLFVPARADGSPVLESGALHIWPRGRRMLIGFPNHDGKLSLSLLLPFTGEDSYESLTHEREVMKFFRANFGDVTDLIPSLAEQFFAKRANSLLTIRCDPWSIGDRALLIGDAAHAVLPSYGQGANAAFEDCAILDRCLAEHAPNFGAAFRQFEALRRPSLDVMADLCVEHFSELCDLIADPSFLKRKEVERRLHELYPDSYRSLYSMVSFSSMPYDQAISLELRQRGLLERLLAREDLLGALDSPAVRGLLQESMAEGRENGQI
jgi:kynurenine 3-monooxygenase